MITAKAKRTLLPYVLVPAACLMMAGCAQQASYAGAVQDASGRATGSIVMTVNRAAFESRIQASTTLPDGEIFTGTIVQDQQAYASTGPVFGPRVFYGGRHGWGYGFGGFYDFGPGGYTAQANTGKAQLTGSRGRTMACDLTFESASSGPFGRGFGTCKLSDGTSIPVTF